MMTLLQQFPDVSKQLREKNKLNSKYTPALLFTDIHYTPMTPDQKFYNRDSKKRNSRLLIAVLIAAIALMLIIPNMTSIWKWISS